MSGQEPVKPCTQPYPSLLKVTWLSLKKLKKMKGGVVPVREKRVMEGVLPAPNDDDWRRLEAERRA